MIGLSGIVDRFADLETNQTVNVQEGSTLVAVSISEDRKVPFLISNGTLIITNNSVRTIQASDLIGRTLRPTNGAKLNLSSGPWVIRWWFDDGTSHYAKILIE